ncbi:defensin Lucifensin-like [Uranotaenia lowii]|uniref:defensin Lucifensin-like n=1 Tax=Uranotaenia lowii TaxID=190385 RepID=UPI00247AD1F5|nr:defensin Lucifensin-like [Uranotaenia lowii]
MKQYFLIFSVLIAVGVFYSSASVVQAENLLSEDEGESFDSAEIEPLRMDSSQHHFRQKRAVCDLLSAIGVKHSACAASCIIRGFVGGYCTNEGVCTCRSTPETRS